MFERFGQSARRAMFLARFEAGHLGSPEIDSHHLLLGTLRDSDPVTQELWRSLDLDEGEIEPRAPAGRMEIPPDAEIRASDEVRRIFALAIEEADAREHAEITACHLVLGMLRVPECEAARLLEQHGAGYEAVSEIAGRLLSANNFG